MSCFGGLLCLTSPLRPHSFQSFTVSGKKSASFFMQPAPFSKLKGAMKAINSVKTPVMRGTLCWTSERNEDHLEKGWATLMLLISKKTLSLSSISLGFPKLSKPSPGFHYLFIWDAVCHSDTLRNWHLQFSHVTVTVTWTDKINCCSHTPTDFVMSLKP